MYLMFQHNLLLSFSEFVLNKTYLRYPWNITIYEEVVTVLDRPTPIYSSIKSSSSSSLSCDKSIASYKPSSPMSANLSFLFIDNV
jgi:hypothetical protein